MTKALLIVDYQNDFADPKGALYVPGGETLKPYILDLLGEYKKRGDLVIATKDWHPPDHCSFRQWPAHAVQGTKGAELYFDQKLVDKVIHKGMAVNAESYGAFYDDHGQSNGLDEYLKKHHVKKITLVGLAFNYCVLKTYQQAQEQGYEAVNDVRGVKAIPE